MEWIVPCNIAYYDVIGAFASLDRINWKQSIKRVDVDDIVYIYIGKPISAIIYKCIVTKINLSHVEIDDRQFRINGENYDNSEKHMELRLLASYTKDQISIEKLAKCGVKGRIQGPRSVIPDLKAYIDSLQQ